MITQKTEENQSRNAQIIQDYMVKWDLGYQDLADELGKSYKAVQRLFFSPTSKGYQKPSEETLRHVIRLNWIREVSQIYNVTPPI